MKRNFLTDQLAPQVGYAIYSGAQKSESTPIFPLF